MGYSKVSIEPISFTTHHPVEEGILKYVDTNIYLFPSVLQSMEITHPSQLGRLPFQIRLLYPNLKYSPECSNIQFSTL